MEFSAAAATVEGYWGLPGTNLVWKNAWCVIAAVQGHVFHGAPSGAPKVWEERTVSWTNLDQTASGAACAARAVWAVPGCGRSRLLLPTH